MHSLAALRRLKLRKGKTSRRHQPTLRTRRTTYEWLENRQLLAVVPQLVRDINSNPAPISDLGNLTNVNGTLFFTAKDATHGTELWKSDGTVAGTILVKDIRSGSDSSDPGSLTNVNGILFFLADDGTHGRELWKSDGTDAGTVLVKDLQAGGGGSNPKNLTNGNGTLFFVLLSRLWKSDGTAAGTLLVQNSLGVSSSSASKPMNINGTLFFAASDGATGTELWKSDGTRECHFP